MRRPASTAMRWLVALLTCASLTACATDTPESPGAGTGDGTPGSVPSPPVLSLSPSPSPSPSEPLVIAGGVTLEPGSDGKLPVKVRWLRSFYALEHIATDGEVVYVSDEVVAALDASTGNYLWEASDPRGDCLCADGGVVIGTQGPDRLRVWAPYNYDLTVDRVTGEIVRLTHRAGGDKPADLKRMKGSRPEEYAINVNVDGVVARTTDGRVAWRIRVDEPWFHPGPALPITGGLVVQLSSGHVLAMDYTTS